MPANQPDQRCIIVNAGGTRYTTTLSTLLSQENSYFTCILSGDWDDKAQPELFLDRDGELFKHVLRFLRASPQGKVDLVQSLSRTDRRALAEEANFFQLDSLSQLLGEPQVPEQHAQLELHYARWWTINQHEVHAKTENAKTADLLSKKFEILSFSQAQGVICFLLGSRQA